MLSPFYLTHLLSHSFHFHPHLKLVDNLLRTPHKESMDLSDETYLRTSYEPNAYDFKETAVKPYTELLDSPPLFSGICFPPDAEYDDAALEGMLREAHRVHSHHWRPVGDRAGCSTNKRTRFLPSARQKLTDTNFKPLTTEVY